MMETKKILELDEEMLEQVSGGTSDTSGSSSCAKCHYRYNMNEHDKCPNCGESNAGQLLKPINIDR